MRKLILGMTLTTDGFVCGPNHELDWFMLTRDEKAKEWIEKSIWESGMHMMGRKTFEVMAPYWVSSNDPIAAPMNAIPKTVFSLQGFEVRNYGDGPAASSWTNATVAHDLVKDINHFKQQEGKPLLAHGGAGFAQELVKHGLVDEFRFVIHPVVIGRGISLFATIPELLELKLISSEPFPSGAIINKYENKK